MKKKQPNEQRITALYARLSRDDEKEGISGSIQNQEKICQGGIYPSETLPQIEIQKYSKKLSISRGETFLLCFSPMYSCNSNALTQKFAYSVSQPHG